jgi:putative SOS response-associated peptidase YedK
MINARSETAARKAALRDALRLRRCLIPWVKSCSILTTTPNAVTSAVHDRMPVILDPDSYDLWLDPGIRDVGAASDLLKPHAARMVRCYPVSTRIKHVVDNDEECSAPVELAQTQARLFQ